MDLAKDSDCVRLLDDLRELEQRAHAVCDRLDRQREPGEGPVPLWNVAMFLRAARHRAETQMTPNEETR